MLHVGLPRDFVTTDYTDLGCQVNGWIAWRWADLCGSGHLRTNSGSARRRAEKEVECAKNTRAVAVMDAVQVPMDGWCRFGLSFYIRSRSVTVTILATAMPTISRVPLTHEI